MHRNSSSLSQSMSQMIPKSSTHQSKSKKHWNRNPVNKSNTFRKCEFRTIYKYRENHKTCHKVSNKAGVKDFNSGGQDMGGSFEGKALGAVGDSYANQPRTGGCDQSQIVGGDTNLYNSNGGQQQYQTAAHQQMKSFIKMMKKGSLQTNNTNRKQLDKSKVVQQEDKHRVATCQSSRSVCSTNSIPKLFHQNHMKTSVTEQQQPSQSINRSTSAIFGKIRSPDPNKYARNSISNQPTLNELQKKVQQLITAKLSKKFDDKVLLRSQVFEDEVDRQLKLLVKQTRLYRSSDEDGDCDVKEIARKICVIQKIIASSSTQSECLKKYFYSKQKNRKKFAIFNPKTSCQPQIHKQITGKCQQNNSRINQYRKYIKKNLSLQNFKNGQNSNINNLSTISLHHSTINMSSYIKPGQQCYRSQLVKEKTYLPNRQPFPRTTYQKEFLSYGAMPTYPPFGRSISQNKRVSLHNQKQNNLKNPPKQDNNCNTRPQTEENKAPTTYKAQYKQKKTKITDSFTLDCRRDKYKNLDISFMPRKSANLNHSYNYGNHSYGSGISNGKYKCSLRKIQRRSEAEQYTRDQQGKQKQNHPTDNPKTPQQASTRTLAPKQPDCHLNPPLNLNQQQHQHPKTEHQSQFIDINNNSFIQSEQKEKNLNKLKYGFKCLFGYGGGNWNAGGLR